MAGPHVLLLRMLKRISKSIFPFVHPVFERTHHDDQFLQILQFMSIKGWMYLLLISHTLFCTYLCHFHRVTNYFGSKGTYADCRSVSLFLSGQNKNLIDHVGSEKLQVTLHPPNRSTWHSGPQDFSCKTKRDGSGKRGEREKVLRLMFSLRCIICYSCFFFPCPLEKNV